MDLPKTVFHLLVPDSDEQKILVHLSDEGKAHLPKVVTCDEVLSWSSHTFSAANAISQALECDVYIRHALWTREYTIDNGVDVEESLIVVDCIYPDGSLKLPILSESTTWMTARDVMKANWKSIHESFDVQNTIQSYFIKLRNHLLIQNQKWRSRGWFQDAIQQVDNILEESLLQRVSNLRQIRNCFQSTVLFCRVRDLTRNFEDWVYVKCTMDFFPEAEATKAIARCLPFIAPKFIGSSSNLFLVWNINGSGGTLLDKSFMCALSRMHIESLTHVEKLSSVIPVRGPLWIAQNVFHLVDRETFVSFGGPRTMDFKQRLKTVKDCCHYLHELGIPLTVVHRDLDLSNIFREDQTDSCGSNIVFIDWASCCIAHPFYDYTRITKTLGIFSVRDKELQASYLNKWLSYGVSLEQIKRGTAAALPLMRIDMLLEILDLCENVTELMDREKLCLTIPRAIDSIISSLDTYTETFDPNSKCL